MPQVLVRDLVKTYRIAERRPGITGALATLLCSPAWILPFTPVFGFAFLGASFLVWRVGVRHYTSTGS